MVVSQTTSESLPSITHHSGGRVVRPDESVTLNCDASDNVHLVQWYKNGGLVSSEPVYTIESFDATSAGNYSCKATVNDVGSITSAVVRLELACKSKIKHGKHSCTIIISNNTTKLYLGYCTHTI